MRNEREATSSQHPHPQVLHLGAACISTTPTPALVRLGLGESVGKPHICIDMEEPKGRMGPPGEKHKLTRNGLQALLVAFLLNTQDIEAQTPPILTSLCT